MPRSRGSEMPQQRHSPRAPLHLKTTACSEANSIRSPKLEDRRSPRSPLHERKKVSDLETKLGQAHEEIEKLKEKLASAEAARLDVQKELEETKKHFPVSPLKNAALDLVDEEKEKTIKMEEEKVEPAKVLIMDKDEPLPAKEDCVKCLATDVFEVVPATNEAEGRKVEAEDAEEGTETKVIIDEEKREEEMGTLAKEKLQEEEEVESPEITELREILAEKNKQLESIVIENQTFIKEAKNARADSSEWRAKADEMATKLAQAEEELKKTKLTAERLREKLESEETAKASMEAEMKRLRVQTEQWRKAAEAAASVLVAGDALDQTPDYGRRLGESGRSMEKNFRGYEVSVGGGGWSPVIPGGEGAEGNSGGKRRGGGGGIRVFGELWKKKGQLK